MPASYADTLSPRAIEMMFRRVVAPFAELLERQSKEIARLSSAVDEIKQKLNGTLKSHYTTAEVARLVRRTEYTVRRWIESGKLEAQKAPGAGQRGAWLIPRESLSTIVELGRGSEVPDHMVAKQ